MKKREPKTKGKPNGKGIKGYFIGGDITDHSSVKDPNYRSYKTGIGANLEDALLFNADNVLSTAGASNVIKSKDYQTRFGATKANQLNEGVSTIGPGVAGAVLNYYAPGAGTALTGATGAIKRAGGTDTGLDEKQTATQGKIGSGLNSLGGLTTMFKKPSSPDTTQSTSVENVPTSTVAPAAAATTSDLDRLYPATDRVNVNNSQNPEDLLYTQGKADGGGIKGYSAKLAAKGKDIGKKGKNFNKIADKAAEEYGSKEAGERVAGAVLNKLRHKATGGEVSPYNPTSQLDYNKRVKTYNDSLNSTTPPTQAINPYLNYDMSIPKEGIQTLPYNGYDMSLDQLSKLKGHTAPIPNYDTPIDQLKLKAHYAKGGELTAEKAATILHDKEVRGKALTDKQRRYMGWVAGGKKADGGEIPKKDSTNTTSTYPVYQKRLLDGNAEYYKGNLNTTGEGFKSANRNFDIASLKGALPINEEEYNKNIGTANVFPDWMRKVKGGQVALVKPPIVGGEIVGAGTGTSDSINANLEDGGFVAIAKKKKEADALRAKYFGEQKPTIASLHSGDTKVKVSDGETYFTEDEKKHIIAKGGAAELNALAPNADIKAKNKANGGGIKGYFEGTPISGISGGVGDDLAKRKWMNQNWDPTTGQTERQASDLYAKTLTDAINQENTTGTQTGTTPPINDNTGKPVVTPPKKNWFDPNNTNVEKGIALAQTGLGVDQLLKQGKRPVDTIPADYLSAVTKAGRESQYGLSPQEEAKVNRDIEIERRGRVAAASQSGLDAQSQLNYGMAAGEQASEANANRSVLSDRLKQEKERYYNTLLGNKAGMSRQLFEDKLNAFGQNQMAGAGLVRAGGENFLGSRRYDREAASANEMNKNTPMNFGNTSLSKQELGVLIDNNSNLTSSQKEEYKKDISKYAKERNLKYTE